MSGGTCDRCRQRVIWTETYANGKRMPVDPTPREDGNLVVINAIGGPPISKVETGPPVDGELRYVSHFATCTAKGKPRRKGKPRGRRR